jgi:putative addiction module component (TIGR02574 family)
VSTRERQGAYTDPVYTLGISPVSLLYIFCISFAGFSRLLLLFFTRHPDSIRSLGSRSARGATVNSQPRHHIFLKVRSGSEWLRQQPRCRIFAQMSIAEIRQLPLSEKLQIMEALWDDLRAHVEGLAVPDWQKEILDSRRRALEQGREQVLEWDEVKGSLGTRQITIRSEDQ